MDDLKQKLKQLAERIDALSVRERGLVFVSMLAVLYLVAYNVVFAPLRTEQVRLERELKSRYQQAQTVDKQLNALLSASDSGADVQNRNKLAALRQQLAELDENMDRMTAGVVTPKEMAKLIEQMLTRNRNLSLVKLEALPATSIDEQAKPAAEAPAGAPGDTVYRHGMRVEFTGRYFDIVDYLKTLEKLPWKVFWGEVSLEVGEHPTSKVTLVIYTLSRYPGWIGV